jgi:ATP-dependent Clp protease adaptor protein ClpS
MTTDVKIEEKVVLNVQVPKLWKVIFLNDDQTPMEFVIDVLTGVFKHNAERAKNLTLEIHNTGSAVAGVYTHEIAETKGQEATHLARSNGFPLTLALEQEY